MDLTAHELRYWPPPGGGGQVISDRPKTAEASYAVPDVVNRVIGAVRSWSSLPPGVKTAGLTPQSLWRHPDASPAVLILMLLDRYGEEMVEWEPQTLKLTMDRDGIQPSGSALTKVLAARAVLGSPSPWKRWDVFHHVCLGLAGEPPNFSFLEEPEIGHLIAGVDLMKMMDPEREIMDEVEKFIAAAFKAEGLVYIPPPLDFAQDELEERQLRCQNCGAEHRDDNDIKCVTCTSTRLHPIPYEFEASKSAIRELFNARHGKPLEAAVDRLPDDAIGNAVYKLLVHWDYADGVRASTIQQLRMIGGQ